MITVSFSTTVSAGFVAADAFGVVVEVVVAPADAFEVVVPADAFEVVVPDDAF